LLLASANHAQDVGQRAGHAGAKARVLVEDGSKQGAARAWQAGNEMEFPGRRRNIVCGGHADTLLWTGDRDGQASVQRARRWYAYATG
jgi:hypothetical protein